MARRRSNQNTSSLDLFLDTICNAFGGIMFISILISILVQMRGEQEHDPSPAKTISHAEARLMEDEYEQLQRARETLRQEIASQEKLLVGDSKEEILDLSNRVEEVQQSIDKAIEKQSELVKRTVSLDTDIVSERESIANLSKELQDARLAVAERGKEIDDALDSKEQSTTLPKVTPTSKGNVVCAMRYGKLYFVTDPQSNLSSDVYKPHTDSRKSLGILYVSPRKTAGWMMPDEGSLQFKSAMQGISPTNTFVSVAVWADSFAEFSDFKKTLNALGYEYDLLPIDDAAELPLGSGSNATVQ